MRAEEFIRRNDYVNKNYQLCPKSSINLINISDLTVIIGVSPAKAVKKGTAVTFTAVSDDFMEDVYFLWYISDNTSFSGIGTSGQTFTNTFLK